MRIAAFHPAYLFLRNGFKMGENHWRFPGERGTCRHTVELGVFLSCAVTQLGILSTQWEVDVQYVCDSTVHSLQEPRNFVGTFPTHPHSPKSKKAKLLKILKSTWCVITHKVIPKQGILNSPRIPEIFKCRSGDWFAWCFYMETT